jgi:hypothetical protein
MNEAIKLLETLGFTLIEVNSDTNSFYMNKFISDVYQIDAQGSGDCEIIRIRLIGKKHVEDYKDCGLETMVNKIKEWESEY